MHIQASVGTSRDIQARQGGSRHLRRRHVLHRSAAVHPQRLAAGQDHGQRNLVPVVGAVELDLGVLLGIRDLGGSEVG